MNNEINSLSTEILLYVGAFSLGAIFAAIIMLIRFKNNIKKMKL